MTSKTELLLARSLALARIGKRVLIATENAAEVVARIRHLDPTMPLVITKAGVRPVGKPK